MYIVDTNILVYAADADCPEHEACRELIERSRTDTLPWFLTWSITYEFLRVSTHPRVFRAPMAPAQSWAFVEALLASPGLDVLIETDRHAAVVERTLAEVPGIRGNLFHDAHIAILMREHGIRRIYTRNSDFHRFPFLEVLDPLAGA